MMNYEKLFALAKENNIEALEIYEETSKQLQISVYKQEIDNYSSSDLIGLGVRGIYNGKPGTTYVETIEDSEMEFIINNIIDSATNIDSTDVVIINDKIEEYRKIETYHKELEKIDTIAISNNLLEIDRNIQELDSRVDQVPNVVYSSGVTEIKIMNSYGINLHRKTNYAYIYAQVIVKDGENSYDAFDYQIFNNLKQFDSNKLCESVVARAIEKINPQKLKSGTYDVIVKNEAMVSLLQALLGSFNGDAVNKGLSILKDKLKEQVFNNKLNIIDDPFLDNGMNCCAFDDEGLKTYEKSLVLDGVVNTFMHNLKTAKIANTRSTGNGFKSGYKSQINVKSTNVYIKKGDKPYQKMIKEMKDGVIITSFQGLHAGMNTLTMDFSLQSQGFRVKNGKITERLTLMIAAGNLLKLLNEQLVDIGNDMYLSFNTIGSPSIRFKDVTITGE